MIWQVHEISLTSDAARSGANAHYRYHVRGINLADDGKSFSWTVPTVDKPEYDLSRVTVPALPKGDAQ